MYKRILFILVFVALNQHLCKAQFSNYIGYLGEATDSSFLFWDTMQLSNMVTDSSGLWQIGETTKPFFTLGNTFGPAIMTDTANSYPTSTDAWFILPVTFTGGDIITFTHKYETTAGQDGCLIELSTDQGTSWSNVKGDCNGDTIGYFSVLTDNIYGFYDTLENGLQAFSGTSNGWITSRIQLFDCCPIKPGKSSSFCNMLNVLVKFRFSSDTIIENLDGWIIDSIKINNYYYPSSAGYVQKQNSTSAHLYPNPATSELTIQTTDQYNTFTITNSIGQKMMLGDLNSKISTLNIKTLPPGLYYISLEGAQGIEVRRFVKI